MSKTRQLRLPWFKFYGDDWLEGTRNLTLAERGAYIDSIALMMKNEGFVYDDDAALAHRLCISTRMWRSVKTELVKKGKLVLSDGKIVNDRCLIELHALMEERKNRSASATAREGKKKTKQAVENDEFRKIANEINDSLAEPCHDENKTSNTPSKPSSQPVQSRTDDEPTTNGRSVFDEKTENTNKINVGLAEPCHESSNIQIQIQIQKEEERDSLSSPNCHSDPLPSGEPEKQDEHHSLDGGFYANGVAIEGSGWRLVYSDIDKVAIDLDIDRDEAHRQALLAAGQWSEKGIVPEDPITRFRNALKRKQQARQGAAQEAMEIWNEMAKRKGLPLVRSLTPSRSKAILARIKEVGGIDGYRAVIMNLEKSGFCLGKNDRGWKADFDFICQSKSFHRLHEGAYANTVKRRGL